MRLALPVVFGACLAASAAQSQGILVETLDDDANGRIIELGRQYESFDPETTTTRQRATVAPNGVLLRALDKVSGEVVDFDLLPSQTKQLGRIQVTLGECRFPDANPAGDAYAHLTIRNAGDDDAVFSGWMVASSPALNALDHARYDVWPLRCKTDATD